MPTPTSQEPPMPKAGESPASSADGHCDVEADKWDAISYYRPVMLSALWTGAIQQWSQLLSVAVTGWGFSLALGAFATQLPTVHLWVAAFLTLLELPLAIRAFALPKTAMRVSITRLVLTNELGSKLKQWADCFRLDRVSWYVWGVLVLAPVPYLGAAIGCFLLGSMLAAELLPGLPQRKVRWFMVGLLVLSSYTAAPIGYFNYVVGNGLELVATLILVRRQVSRQGRYSLLLFAAAMFQLIVLVTHTAISFVILWFVWRTDYKMMDYLYPSFPAALPTCIFLGYLCFDVEHDDHAPSKQDAEDLLGTRHTFAQVIWVLLLHCIAFLAAAFGLGLVIENMKTPAREGSNRTWWQSPHQAQNFNACMVIFYGMEVLRCILACIAAFRLIVGFIGVDLVLKNWHLRVFKTRADAGLEAASDLRFVECAFDTIGECLAAGMESTLRDPNSHAALCKYLQTLQVQTHVMSVLSRESSVAAQRAALFVVKLVADHSKPSSKIMKEFIAHPRLQSMLDEVVRRYPELTFAHGSEVLNNSHE